MFRTQSHRRTRARHNSLREGVAATEFAVCLPVLVLLMLGVIETSTMVFLKQSLEVAAYEGAHMGVMPDSERSDVIDICEAILTDRRVNGATIDVVPADLGSVAPGDFFEVRVSAPTNANAILPLNFFSGMTLSSSASFMKEI